MEKSKSLRALKIRFVQKLQSEVLKIWSKLSILRSKKSDLKVIFIDNGHFEVIYQSIKQFDAVEKNIYCMNVLLELFDVKWPWNNFYSSMWNVFPIVTSSQK